LEYLTAIFKTFYGRIYDACVIVILQNPEGMQILPTLQIVAKELGVRNKVKPVYGKPLRDRRQGHAINGSINNLREKRRSNFSEHESGRPVLLFEGYVRQDPAGKTGQLDT
jgi:hypothetical protein